MPKSKISLIIPAYNEEKYIGKCLDYAIKNAGKDLHEIIVVDNASCDHTREIARKYPNVKIVLEKKVGLTRARQRGFLEATGDILAYIDSDTKMPKGWVKMIINEFEADKKMASLSGPYYYYDLPSKQKLIVTLYWHLLAFPFYLIVGYMVIGGNFAIRRNVLKKMDGFDSSIEFYGEDTDIARRANMFGKVKFKMNFVMPTSARRLSTQGLVKTAIIYIVNFLSEALIRKPVTKKYKNIR